MSHILIVGRNGQLARALRTHLDKCNRPYTCVGRDDVDLTQDPQRIVAHIQNNDITAVINASAFTNVDGAETARDDAHFLNAMAPGMMALACSEKSIPFIHISTDYVFDGTADTPYRPDAPLNPINVYGQTKAAGERAILALDGAMVIVRTSWVYDGTGKNFLTTMLRLAKSRASLSVVDDQIGRPTYAGHLAAACLHLLDYMPPKSTVFHVTNSGTPVSWAGFAREIFKVADIECDVVPISTQDYPTPAKRPAYSVLDISDFENETGHTMPDWKDGLSRALKERT